MHRKSIQIVKNSIFPLFFHGINITLKGAEKVTVHHLLSHTSGLPQYGDLMDVEDLTNNLWRRTYSSDRMISVLTHYTNKSQMVNEAGEEFQYNSLNYVFLGLILEKATNSSFKELLKNRICRTAWPKRYRI